VGLGDVEIGFGECSCGLVYQSPTVDPVRYNEFYSNTHVYANSGRGGEPSQEKVIAVDRQLDLLCSVASEPGKALQVGCSDGYTMHRLMDLGWDCTGVDPSLASAAVAKEKYGIDVDVCFFEDWYPPPGVKYDLLVITHVLEHLLNPLEILNAAIPFLNDDGIVLQEVPAIMNPELWPPAFFTMEHANYFTPATMTRTLASAGMVVVEDKITAQGDLEYPYYTCVARLAGSNSGDSVSSYFRDQEKHWDRIDSYLKQKMENLRSVVIWGAGLHTTYLLSNTHLSEYIPIDFIVDSDKSKIGLKLRQYPVCSPESIDFNDPDLGIIVSSHSAEQEILSSIGQRGGCAVAIGLYGN